MYDLKLLDGDCFINGKFIKTNIYIKNGKIAEITDAVLPASDSYTCSCKKVLPGLIDPHVHFALDLGEFESADDFESGSKTAAYGGVTTIIDFLDPILTNGDYKEIFKRRLEQAEESHLDYAFHCALGNYLDNPDELYALLEHDGISSIKVFTAYSESNRRCSYNVIKKLLSSKFLVLSHSEEDALVNSSHKDVESFESSRPEIAEMRAVKKLAELLKETNGKLYIVHTSSGNTIKMLKDEYFGLLNKNLFIESCPQYFYLDNLCFKEDDGRKYLLAPPLRDASTIESLKNHISFIDTIATDHCPFMLDEKFRYLEADKVPKGIGSVEYAFVLMYGLFGDKVIDKFTKAPAKIFNLENKGEIKVGFDADICVFNPNDVTKITSGHSKSDYSVYDGMILQGKMISTISRGVFIVKDRLFLGGTGRYIRRKL